MTREFPNSLQTYLAGNSFVSVLLVKIQKPDNAYTLWTDAPYDIDFNGDTYLAQGDFLSITEGQETSEIQIHSVSIQISALDVNNITTYATSNIINRTVEIRRAFLDPVTQQLQGDSAGDSGFLLFKGRVAAYAVNNNVNNADIVLQVSSQFINFQRTSGRRSNLTNFQREHPDDFGMEYSHETLTEINWGKSA
jgi:hypothetical protein